MNPGTILTIAGIIVSAIGTIIDGAKGDRANEKTANDIAEKVIKNINKD